jgi:hypothetical protein
MHRALTPIPSILTDRIATRYMFGDPYSPVAMQELARARALAGVDKSSKSY